MLSFLMITIKNSELGAGTHAQLVPHAIHSNLDHSGAIAYNKYLKKIGAISE